MPTSVPKITCTTTKNTLPHFSYQNHKKFQTSSKKSIKTSTQRGKRVVKSSIIFSYWLSSLGVLSGTSPDTPVAALQATLLYKFPIFNKPKSLTCLQIHQITINFHKYLEVVASRAKTGLMGLLFWILKLIPEFSNLGKSGKKKKPNDSANWL